MNKKIKTPIITKKERKQTIYEFKKEISLTQTD